MSRTQDFLKTTKKGASAGVLSHQPRPLMATGPLGLTMKSVFELTARTGATLLSFSASLFVTIFERKTIHIQVFNHVFALGARVARERSEGGHEGGSAE